MTGKTVLGSAMSIALLVMVTACSGADDQTAATTTDSTSTPVAAPAAPVPAAPTTGLPAGVTAEMVAAGETTFKTGICVACHGVDAAGTPNAPSLRDNEWLNNDGSYEQIQATIKTGVAAPKKHPTPMPPMGGGQFTDQQVSELAAYIYSISHTS
ncbi:MAG: c-type cytochrome [Longimicrobiales bacterium]